jgi:hypothetical protein
MHFITRTCRISSLACRKKIVEIVHRALFEIEKFGFENYFISLILSTDRKQRNRYRLLKCSNNFNQLLQSQNYILKSTFSNLDFRFYDFCFLSSIWREVSTLKDLLVLKYDPCQKLIKVRHMLSL